MAVSIRGTRSRQSRVASREGESPAEPRAGGYSPLVRGSAGASHSPRGFAGDGFGEYIPMAGRTSNEDFATLFLPVMLT